MKLRHKKIDKDKNIEQRLRDELEYLHKSGLTKHHKVYYPTDHPKYLLEKFEAEIYK